MSDKTDTEALFILATAILSARVVCLLLLSTYLEGTGCERETRTLFCC